MPWKHKNKDGNGGEEKPLVLLVDTVPAPRKAIDFLAQEVESGEKVRQAFAALCYYAERGDKYALETCERIIPNLRGERFFLASAVLIGAYLLSQKNHVVLPLVELLMDVALRTGQTKEFLTATIVGVDMANEALSSSDKLSASLLDFDN